jgi:hypothetical protein
MKLNTNLPAFNGYYGSIFEDVDTSGELEYVNELRIEKGLTELENDNDFNYNYDAYYSELNNVLTNCVEDFLIGLGMVKNITFIKMHSPKFYNYTNDVIECKIDINIKVVKDYIKENEEQFVNYLENNFKSRDGFSSFYEYDIEHWFNRMKTFKQLDHIEIHAILDFICELEDFDIVNQLYNVGMYDIPYLTVQNIDELTN